MAADPILPLLAARPRMRAAQAMRKFPAILIFRVRGLCARLTAA
jgi:hypothetical protein